MKTFPKPLSIQEEREYLKRYKEGDLEAREVLINRNLRLVAHVIKKYQQTGYDMDDLLSVGTIGLIKAVNTFNVEKGSRLATYAAKCVENEILMMFRSGKKFSKEVSIYDLIGADKDGETVSLLDVLEATDREVLETVIIKQEVKYPLRGVQGESHGDGADHDPHEIWIIWDEGTHAEGDHGKTRDLPVLCVEDRKTGGGAYAEAFYEPAGNTL